MKRSEVGRPMKDMGRSPICSARLSHSCSEKRVSRVQCPNTTVLKSGDDGSVGQVFLRRLTAERIDGCLFGSRL